MKLSETIRSRRGMLGMTQEQLADALGVTAAAVSKWENSLSLPDMTLLPTLARLLETDPNTLLDFAAEPTRSEIGELLNRLHTIYQEKGLDAALDLARRKLREYPASALLQLNLAITLDGLTASRPERRNELLPEILTLYEKAAASADESVSRQAKGCWSCATGTPDATPRPRHFCPKCRVRSCPARNSCRLHCIAVRDSGRRLGGSPRAGC